MNLTEMYVASPDWLKLVWILAPCATAYGIARVFGRKPRRMPAPQEAEWVEVKRLG